MKKLIFAVLVLRTITMAQANTIHTQLASLSEGKRAAIFSKMISGEGEKCPIVNTSFFQGADSMGNAFWSVACSNGQGWQIMIANTPTGSPRMVNCAVLKMLNSNCFKKFK